MSNAEETLSCPMAIRNALRERAERRRSVQARIVDGAGSTLWRQAVVGPLVLLREHGADAQEWRGRLQECADWIGRTMARAAHVALLALGPALALMSNASVRHWIVEMVLNVAVVGGFVAAPALSLTAWVGLALPEQIPLHQASSGLFVVALVWVCAAVVIAHMHEGAVQPGQLGQPGRDPE